MRRGPSPTYHWRIAKALDCLKDAAAYGAHREGAATVIHDAPGAADRGKRRRRFSPTNRKTFANVARDAAEANAGPSATRKRVSVTHEDKES